MPGLDVFVVAVTKEQNQLKLRLETKSTETGLDIVYLALGDVPSGLGALCVEHWVVLREFFPDLDATSDDWVRTQRESAKVREIMSLVRAEIRGLATRKLVSEKAADERSRRWSQSGVAAESHNRVLVNEAISRPRFQVLLEDWWAAAKAGIAVLEGEEGTGKTWVAAAFAESSNASDAQVVFWLDSLTWSKAVSVEEIIHLALSGIFPPGDDRLPRLKRKVFQRWSGTLVILDGANERDGWDAKERLLYNYRQHSAELLSRVRLIFTSRPLEHRPRVGRNFWHGATMIPVGSFDATEFANALARFAPGVQPNEFTDRVRELAVIPRYFQLCIRLKERLASLSHLNKQMLLWADLEDKLNHRDPQWLAMGAELNATPAQILARLAQRIGWPTSASVPVANEELQRHLPNFQKVCNDLAQQRIVLGSDLGETQLSGDHLILGWALALRSFAEDRANEDGDSLCDGLQRLLEPAASNDDKARAVHVAALLSLLGSDAHNPSTQNARVALIRLWASHHNATVSAEDLEFFIGSDLPAYAVAVEAFFRTHLSGNFESTLIQPLARMWRDQRGDVGTLRAVLVRWLRLIFPGDASGSKDGKKTPPAYFQAAATAEQMRLSYAAIGVISFQPELQLLPALADCYQSDDYCCEDFGTPAQIQRLPVKSPSEPLGILLRWHYGESALPEVARMAGGLSRDSEEWKNLHWFARLWRAVELPAALGTGKDIHSHDPKRVSEPYYDFRKFLNGSDPSKSNLIGLDYLGRLAVRRDLPSLNDGEVAALIAGVRSRVAHLATCKKVAGSWEERCLDELLPWLARYATDEFENAVRDLWMAAILSPETLQRLLNLDELTPARDPGGILVDTVLSQATQILQQEHGSSAATYLTELMLLHALPEQLLEWLRHLEAPVISERCGSSVVGILPLPKAFQYLAPSGFCALARIEAEAAGTRLESHRDDPAERRRARHWLQVFAYVTEATSEVVEWALSLADACDDDDELRFPLFAIASRTDDLRLLQRALFHQAFREYDTGYCSWRWALAFPKGNWPALTFSELEGRVSLTVSGWLLLCAKQDNELRSWGRTLAKQALQAVDADDLKPPRTTIQVCVGRDGEQEGFGFESLPSGGENWHDTASSAWGVDRQMKRPSPSQADRDRTLADFQQDMEDRRKSVRKEFTGFNAAGPLLRWSELDPDEFIRFAEAFLPRVEKCSMGVASDFSFFSHAVVIALLKHKPEAALLFGEWSKDNSRTHVATFGGALSWGTEMLWDRQLNGSAAVEAMRRRLLLDAPHDEELFWHCLAAESAGNFATLVALASEWLVSERAPNRALAVSLLAVQGDEASQRPLAQLRDTDPSYWVREHANWAWEVGATEFACRKRYQEILTANSLAEVAAGLAEIRLALSPMAYAWHSAYDSVARETLDRRIHGYIRLFWYHWGNTSSRKNNIKVCGRELRQHCRGEGLKDGITSRMAPWWQIDDHP